nr:MAG TPA: short tail fiber protein [Caudoviricetes sp.]
MNGSLASTTLKATLPAGQKSIEIDPTDFASFGQADYFGYYITLAPADKFPTLANCEIVYVSRHDGNTLIVERGMRGTASKTFPPGSLLYRGIYRENGANVGDIFMTMKAYPSPGRLFMDGSGDYRNDQYPILSALVEQYLYYGERTGPNTFKLADLRGRFPYGTPVGGNVGQRGGSDEINLSPNNYQANTWMSQKMSPAASPSGAVSAGNTWGFHLHAVSNNPSDSSKNVPVKHLPPYFMVNYEIVAG